MKYILSLLNIDFLLKEDSMKNWRMILFISTLAMISIASGHSADKKIYQIANLNNELKRVKSEFVENKSELMFLKLETRKNAIATNQNNLVFTLALGSISPKKSQKITGRL